MKNRKNQILVIILLMVVLAFVAFLLIAKPFAKKGIAEIAEQGETLAYMDVSNYSEVDKEVIEMYRFLLYGKHKATTNTGETGYNFEFNEDGKFVGYTQAEPDDLGFWKLEKVNGKCCLVVTTVNISERYDIDFNNNDDVVLKANDGTAYILSDAE